MSKVEHKANFDAQTEGVPEASQEKVREAVRRSPQRTSFDIALNGLLIAENLSGTRWAIEQLMDSAASAHQAGEASPEASYFHDMALTLRTAAQELEKMLDKRAAELAMGGN